MAVSLRPALERRGLTGIGSPWDIAPRAADLADPAAYRTGVGLWRRLRRGDYTMLSCRRGRALHRLARRVDREGVPGALVDCGVWNGGSTALLAAGAPSREVWAFDSFEGLPEPGELDGEESRGWAGRCYGAEARLREVFARAADPERLHVARGWFQDTFPVHAPEIGPVAILHADGDWYESVRLTLETFWPSVPVGGHVVIDDYGHWPGARRAVDEFRATHRVTAPLRRADYSGVHWRRDA